MLGSAVKLRIMLRKKDARAKMNTRANIQLLFQNIIPQDGKIYPACAGTGPMCIGWNSQLQTKRVHAQRCSQTMHSLDCLQSLWESQKSTLGHDTRRSSTPVAPFDVSKAIPQRWDPDLTAGPIHDECRALLLRPLPRLPCSLSH